MLDKLEAIQERFYYLEERLSDPSIVSDQKVFAKTNKDYSALREVVEVFKEYKEVLGNIDTAK
ncbi:MAG: PCRF domain-containing protein, partial [Saprospiraceae bacterium]